MKKDIAITLDEKVLEEIDKRRGLIPRSTYINAQFKNWYDIKP